MTLPLIYIAGPFRGPTPYDVHRNVCQAEAYGLTVAQLGGYPVIPHTMTQHFDKQLTDEFWLAGTMELLRRSDAVYLIPGWQRSTGASLEANEAKRLTIPIFEETDVLERWIAAWKANRG